MSEVDTLPARALLITGTVGAGKTSVADAIGSRLAAAEVPNAVIDLDWLRRSWPSPPGDRFNGEMERRNLRSVARNYLDAGANRLVLAGVVEGRRGRAEYQDIIGVPLAVCRLRVDLAVVRRRLIRRHHDEEEALRWHLNRSGELDTILDAAAVEDFTVDATDRTVPDVAAAVVEAAGWSVGRPVR